MLPESIGHEPRALAAICCDAHETLTRLAPAAQSKQAYSNPNVEKSWASSGFA